MFAEMKTMSIHEWQTRKMRPTQFGDNKNRPQGRASHTKITSAVIRNLMQAGALMGVRNGNK